MIAIFLSLLLGLFTYSSGSLTNTWYWSVSTGEPAFYSVEISYDDGTTWLVLEEISATEKVYEHQGELCRFWTYISPQEETYRLRVRARDVTGEVWSEYSEASDSLTIAISDAPGQPKLYELMKGARAPWVEEDRWELLEKLIDLLRERK